MSTITLQEFVRDPSSQLARVQTGESLLVVRDGDPVAELRPVVPARSTPRPFGLAAEAFSVPDDFDSPLPDELVREFEGS